MFKRIEVVQVNGEYKITLHLSPFLEEFSSEFGTDTKGKSDLKKSAIEYVRKNVPQIKSATISVVVGSFLVASFPMKGSAQTTSFTMSYLFFGNTKTYLSEIDKTKGNLNQVSPSFFNLNEDGSLLITNEFSSQLVSEVHKRKMKIVPFLSNHWDRELGRAALHNRVALSKQIADFIEKNNLDGVNIDIENVTDEDRDAYTDLVRLIRSQVPKDKQVSVAVAANPYGWTEGWHGSYDYKALAKVSDYLFIMAYDEHYEGGPPGPVASIDWVEQSIKYALDQGIPNKKIVLGIPFFGRYWKDGSTTGGDGVPANQVDALVAKYKGVVTYDKEAQSPKAIITIKQGDPLPVIHGYQLQPGSYTFWYENPTSIKAKVDLVNKYKLMGTGSWSLGDENVQIWNNYKSRLTTSNGKIPAATVTKKTSPPNYPILKYGSKGTEVSKLQNALKKQTFYSGHITGLFDMRTKDSVVIFQKRYKLKVDGIAGNETLGKLYSLPIPK